MGCVDEDGAVGSLFEVLTDFDGEVADTVFKDIAADLEREGHKGWHAGRWGGSVMEYDGGPDPA